VVHGSLPDSVEFLKTSIVDPVANFVDPIANFFLVSIKPADAATVSGSLYVAELGVSRPAFAPAIPSRVHIQDRTAVPVPVEHAG
jgi:hypothetical protein